MGMPAGGAPATPNPVAFRESLLCSRSGFLPGVRVVPNVQRQLLVLLHDRPWEEADMVLEAAALTAGRVVGERAGRLWLAGRRAKAERESDLVDLISFRFQDQISRRKVERQLQDISDTVAERILTLAGHEYPNLMENEKNAAIIAVGDTLKAADLSDDAIFDSNIDAIRLASQVRVRIPDSAATADLSEPAAHLYGVVLAECCDCLVRIVRQLPSFGARADVELLKRTSQISFDVTSLLARVPIRSLDSPDGTASDDEFRRRYLEQVSMNLDSVELFGVRLERLRPKTALTVSYISLSVSVPGDPGTSTNQRPDAERAHRVAEWKAAPSEQSSLRVEAALSRSNLTLIRGEAGSGKSTLLRWLAITAARGTFTADLSKWNSCIPFLIKLRSYAEERLPRPEQFLAGVADNISGLMPAGWVHRQLSSGRALLLVDGIDELPTAQRRRVRTWIDRLVRDYDMRVVVTSRPAAASSDWLARQAFSTALMERMGPADVRSLIIHWHAAMNDAGDLPCPPEKLASYETALLARIEAAPHLQMLASNPLLATMLCALNLDRDTQLPRDRMGLYSAILELLLERRDSERHIPSYQEVAIEREQKIQLLQDLAWRLSITNRTELPKEVVVRSIHSKLGSMPKVEGPAEAVLEHLLQRSGVIREPVLGRIDFVHRTLQEYLAAQQAADDGDMQPIIDNAHRDQWYNIVVMTAGHSNMPLREELINGLIGRASAEPRIARRMTILVAACLETLPSVPPTIGTEISRCLDELVPPRDLASARSLALIGEPLLERLPHVISNLGEGAARACVRTAWLINGPKALGILSRYGKDKRRPVQNELLKAWEYFDAVEYASRVLADTPFAEGFVSLTSASLIPGLRYLKQCKQLVIEERVSDLFFVQDLPNLTHLAIQDLALCDLNVLSRNIPQLTHLRLYIVGGDIDIGPLTQLRALQDLSLAIEDFDNLEFVCDLPQLYALELSCLSGVTDLRPLMSQRRLMSLELEDVTHLRGLEQLPPLSKLHNLAIRGATLETDLADLVRRAPGLSKLALRGSKWQGDLTPLTTLALDSLELWDCEVVDISPLGAIPQLSFLDLEDTLVEDLSSLAELGNLRILYLTGCHAVKDLSPLAQLPSLRHLYIEGLSPTVDVSPLAANRDLKIHASAGHLNASRLGRRIIMTPYSSDG